MAKYLAFYRSSTGDIVDASVDTDVFVYDPGTTNEKTVYSDEAMTVALVQPFDGGADGSIEFFGDTGQYRVKATKPGYGDFDEDNLILVHVTTDGKLGVGAGGSPDEKLHVVDPAADCFLKVESGKAGGQAGIIFANDSVSEWDARIDAGDNFAIVSPAGTKPFRIFVGAPGNALHVDAFGKVGFGKTPGSKLDIALTTEDLEIVDAGSAAATEQGWVEVEHAGVQGYMRIYAAK